MTKVYRHYIKGYDTVSFPTQKVDCRIHFTKNLEANTIKDLNKKVKSFKDSFKNPTIIRQVNYVVDNNDSVIKVLDYQGIPDVTVTPDNIFNYVK